MKENKCKVKMTHKLYQPNKTYSLSHPNRFLKCLIKCDSKLNVVIRCLSKCNNQKVIEYISKLKSISFDLSSVYYMFKLFITVNEGLYHCFLSDKINVNDNNLYKFFTSDKQILFKQLFNSIDNSYNTIDEMFKDKLFLDSLDHYDRVIFEKLREVKDYINITSVLYLLFIKFNGVKLEKQFDMDSKLESKMCKFFHDG